MRVFFTDQFVLPRPDGHRFPMEKYARLRERVAAELLAGNDMVAPEAASDADLLRAHTPEYVARVRDGSLSRDEIRRIGFPWSPAMVERSRRSAGATIGARASPPGTGSSSALSPAARFRWRSRWRYARCIDDTVAIHFERVRIAAEISMRPAAHAI
jgi:hypothetical protein